MKGGEMSMDGDWKMQENLVEQHGGTIKSGIIKMGIFTVQIMLVEEEYAEFEKALLMMF